MSQSHIVRILDYKNKLINLQSLEIVEKEVYSSKYYD